MYKIDIFAYSEVESETYQTEMEARLQAVKYLRKGYCVFLLKQAADGDFNVIDELVL